MKDGLLFQRAVVVLLVALFTAALGPSVRGQTVISGPYSGTQIPDSISILTGTSATFLLGAGFTGANATLGDNAFLLWNQNGTLAGKTFSVGYNSGIIVGPANTLTLDSATSVGGGVWLYSDNAGAALTNQGIIHHTTGTGYVYAPTFVNQGSIAAGTGTYLYVGYTPGYSITNAPGGTITADGANALVNLRSINNQGTLTAQNGGTLYFRDANYRVDLGNVAIGTGGGHAYLAGTLNNIDGTLNAPAGGSFELYGGTINEGSIGAGALAFTSSGGVLQNVTYQGDLAVGTNATVSFGGSTTFTGANATLGDYASVGWYRNGTLSGKTITLGTAAGFIVGAGNSLTLDAATGVGGGVYLYSDAAGASITNQGAIHHTVGTGYIYAPTFVNQGTIAAGTNTNLYVGYTPGYSITNAGTGNIVADGANANISLIGVTNQGTLTAQNGGALIFRGNNTTADLGTVTFGTGGGHAYLAGTLDNTNATLPAPTGGSFELYGGTINYGQIAPGALTFTSSGGTLNNVTYGATLTMPASTSFTATNGTTIGQTVTLADGSGIHWNQFSTLTGSAVSFGNGAYIDVGPGGVLTIDPSTSATGDVSISSGNTGASIINQGVIHHTAGTGYLFAPTFTNQGAITGGTNTNLWVGYYGGYTNTNGATGTITADGANAGVYLYGLVNQGNLTAQNGGALYFEGNNVTADLGNVTIGTGGGHAYLYNTLNNTNATLTAPAGGRYELYGGTINNGTIAPGALSFTWANGTLGNVSYAGDLTVPASTYVTFSGGTNVMGANLTLGDSAGLYYYQNGTLSGKALALGNYAYVLVGANDALTLDPTVTVTGNASVYSSYAGSSVVNQGTITHTLGAGYLYAPTFSNQGTITAGPGTYLWVGYQNGFSTTNATGGAITADGAGSTVYLYGLKNQGAVTAQNGGVLDFQGNNLTADLGSVTIGAGGGHAYLANTLDNTGATLNAPAGGRFELFAGTINNGTVAPGALSFTGSGGTLNNVSYGGDFNLPASTSVTWSGGTAAGGTNLTLGDYSSLTWSQNGTLAGKALTFGTGAYLYVGAGDTLTLDAATTAAGDVTIYAPGAGAAITNQGIVNQTTGSGTLSAPTFTNQGTINVGTGAYLYLGSSSTGFTFGNTAAGSINVNGGYASVVGPLTNAGLLNVQSGTFWTNYSSSLLTNSATGTVMGSGTIIGSLTLAGGTLSPGNSIGTLTIASGNLIVANPANLNVELGGAAADQVLFQNPTGVVDIGPGLLTLNLTLLGAPTAATYNLLSLTGGTDFNGYFAGLPLSGNTLTATYLGVPYVFSVQYLSTGASLNFAAVPEPGIAELLGAGLALLAGAAWRRQRRSR